MKLKAFLLLFIPFFILSSCSTDTKNATSVKEKKVEAPAIEKFVTGTVIDKVINLNNPTQSYALYLPSTYSSDKAWPVLYLFDPHGEGKLPLSIYKNLAEKYGYILIGSNDSKNGIAWQGIQAIADNLFSDSQQRLSIHASRIYVSGFSGGARIANGLCIMNGSIAGVICCGAASPATNSKDPRNNYTFLGICGNRDFNYVEMRKYDMVELAGRNIKHAFIEFDGKHEWPSEKIMQEGFLWTELCAMRKEPALKNDAFIQENISIFSNQLKAAQAQNNTFGVYKNVTKIIVFFNGLTDLTEFYNIYSPLKANAEVDKGLKHEEATWKKEEQLRALFSQNFQSKNNEWWKQEIISINKKIKSGSKDESLIYSRILDFLSLISYMQTTGMLQQQNLHEANIMCQRYLLIDPTNSEAHYLNASTLAMEKKNKEAIAALNEAINYGFNDAARLENDPSFNQLKSTEEFKNSSKKVKQENISTSVKQ